MQTVLAKIVADKAIWVETRKQQQPLASFQNEVQPSTRHFYDALQGARTAFILECKKASPSKGVIRDDFDPARIAAIYKHYASAISVLTDEKYFQGSFDFLPIVSQIAPQPILCKDFIIDPYQIYLARYYQADACLLMLSVLDDEQYRQLAAVAQNRINHFPRLRKHAVRTANQCGARRRSKIAAVNTVKRKAQRFVMLQRRACKTKLIRSHRGTEAPGMCG